MKTLTIILISGIVSGCVLMGSYRINVSSELISASGHAGRSHKRDRLEQIVIDLTKVNRGVCDDIWIELSPGEKTSLGSITRKLLMEHKVEHHANCSDCYFFGRLTFEFDGEALKRVDIVCGESPAAKKEFNPRVGSIHRGASLTLPCTIRQFESVFGDCDEVSRYYYYETM